MARICYRQRNDEAPVLWFCQPLSCRSLRFRDRSVRELKLCFRRIWSNWIFQRRNTPGEICSVSANFYRKTARDRCVQPANLIGDSSRRFTNGIFHITHVLEFFWALRAGKRTLVFLLGIWYEQGTSLLAWKFVSLRIFFNTYNWFWCCDEYTSWCTSWCDFLFVRKISKNDISAHLNPEDLAYFSARMKIKRTSSKTLNERRNIRTKNRRKIFSRETRFLKRDTRATIISSLKKPPVAGETIFRLTRPLARAQGIREFRVRPHFRNTSLAISLHSRGSRFILFFSSSPFPCLSLSLFSLARSLFRNS